MPSSAPDIRAKAVRCTSDMLEVTLRNGLVLSTPLSQFPRLKKGTPRQRNQWRFICDGTGIHWESLDEDISVEGLLKAFVRRLPQDVLKAAPAPKFRFARNVKVTIPA